MPLTVDFVSRFQSIAKDQGFDHFGLSPLSQPLTMAYYRQWLEDGHHATMDYLKRHLPLKADPQAFQPKARSALVLAKRYHPHPYPDAALQASPLRIALYAQGEDYHMAFMKELEAIAEQLREAYPNEEFLCFTDSAPILERDLAVRAGLGWVGKNTCLLNPQQGSLFLLGEILTSVETASAPEPLPDLCGTCDRCIRACPTGALISPKVLNANACISYWTIEAKTVPPVPLRKGIGDWFFGCDICQTVCPWNEKVFGRQEMVMNSQNTLPSNESTASELRWILNASDAELKSHFNNTPLMRAKPFGLRRNALVVIANLGLSDLKPEVEATRDNHPNLSELALWTLDQLQLASV